MAVSVWCVTKIILAAVGRMTYKELELIQGVR